MKIPYIPHVFGPNEGPRKELTPPVFYFEDFVAAGTYDPNAGATSGNIGFGLLFSETADSAPWLVTVVDGGSDNGETILLLDNQYGGQVALKTNDADSDSLACQLNGEAFRLADDRSIVFEARLHLDVLTGYWAVGLGITDTSPEVAISDYILFGNTSDAGAVGTADIRCATGKNVGAGDEALNATAVTGSTVTDSGVDLTASTFVTLRFEVEGTSSVTFYVNGTQVAKHTTNLPDDEHMTPTIFLEAQAGAANTMTLDWILCASTRSSADV